MIFGADPFGTEFDEVVAKIRYASYSSSVTVWDENPAVRYHMDGKLKAKVAQTYKMSARIGVPSPYYDMDVVLVLDKDDPRYLGSFASAFFWTYADQYRKIDAAIQSMVSRLKLDFATSDDLDDYWGQVLGVRRRYNEADEDYRTRLATHIRVITSSGTSTNIRAVVDRITGIAGGSVLEPFYPATLRLSWTSPDIAKVAETQDALISAAMDRAVASGISWSTAYPYMEYSMDAMAEAPQYAGYLMDAAVAKRRGYNYYMTTGLWNDGSSGYDEDVALAVDRSATYRMKEIAIASVTAAYRMAVRSGTLSTASYDINTRLLTFHMVSYDIDTLLGKPYTATYSENALVHGWARGHYRMSAIISGA
jgi:hypothetical protein